MLRATSEIAVAIRVESVLEKPRCIASARPCARAGTMSASDAMGTRISSAIRGEASDQAVEEHEAFLEVESGVERLEIQLEVHHRYGDLGLDADDHRLCAA